MNRKLEMPALNGQTVTEFHARICREQGHATHTVDGRTSGTCPRCGEVTEPAETTTGSVAVFDMLLSLEREVSDNRALAQAGADRDTQARGLENWKAAKVRLSSWLDELSSAELIAFHAYRKARI
jgi:hypothetical protein